MEKVYTVIYKSSLGKIVDEQCELGKAFDKYAQLVAQEVEYVAIIDGFVVTSTRRVKKGKGEL